jgi:cullin 1
MAASGISWEEGRLKLHNGFRKMIDIIEGGMKSSFTLREQMELYSLVYTMCTQKAPRNFSAEIYQEYDVILRDYCVLEILPVISTKSVQSDDAFLAEFVKRWKNHKLLVRAAYDVCYYLDRYHVPRQNISSLRDVGVNKFKTLVFNPIKDRCFGCLLCAYAFLTLCTAYVPP